MKKKSRKTNIKNKNNNFQKNPAKKKIIYLPIISYIYSIILTLLTLYSWFPTFTINPQTMYFDGYHKTVQFVVENNSFIPVNIVNTKIHIKSLEINKSSFTEIRQIINDNKLLYSNKPRTIPFNVFLANLQPIKEIKNSNLSFTVSYQIPFIPITMQEEHNFSAIIDSKVSIKWLHK